MNLHKQSLGIKLTNKQYINDITFTMCWQSNTVRYGEYRPVTNHGNAQQKTNRVHYYWQAEMNCDYS